MKKSSEISRFITILVYSILLRRIEKEKKRLKISNVALRAYRTSAVLRIWIGFFLCCYCQCTDSASLLLKEIEGFIIVSGGNGF